MEGRMWAGSKIFASHHNTLLMSFDTLYGKVIELNQMSPKSPKHASESSAIEAYLPNELLFHHSAGLNFDVIARTTSAAAASPFSIPKHTTHSLMWIFTDNADS